MRLWVWCSCSIYTIVWEFRILFKKTSSLDHWKIINIISSISLYLMCVGVGKSTYMYDFEYLMWIEQTMFWRHFEAETDVFVGGGFVVIVIDKFYNSLWSFCEIMRWLTWLSGRTKIKKMCFVCSWRCNVGAIRKTKWCGYIHEECDHICGVGERVNFHAQKRVLPIFFFKSRDTFLQPHKRALVQFNDKINKAHILPDPKIKGLYL